MPNPIDRNADTQARCQRNWQRIASILKKKTAVGTVDSVALSLPSEFTVSGSPVTDSGTLTAVWHTQAANKVFAGPTTGSAATPAFRLLVAADIPDLSATYFPQSGTLAIAHGGTGQTTANAAFNALTPSQSSKNGALLRSDGTNTAWNLDVFVDATNHRLGVNNVSPSDTLDIHGVFRVGDGTNKARIGTGIVDAAARFDITYPSNGAVRFFPNDGSFVDGCAFQGFGGTDAGFPGQMYFDYGSQSRVLAGRQAVWRSVGGGAPVTVFTLDANGKATFAGTVDVATITSGTGTTTFTDNVSFTPTGGSVNRTINFGAGFGTPAIYLFDGGAGGRWGWGLNAGEMQFFATTSTGNHFSWNIGGDFQSAGTNELMRLTQAASVPHLGIGVTAPTAILHLKAGTATAGTAPLKLSSGANLTTPEDGTFEYDGTHLYFTIGVTRHTLI